MNTTARFLTLVSAPDEIAAARLLIESLQTFGGEMSSCPVWVFTADAQTKVAGKLASPQVKIIPVSVPETIKHYPFGGKVLACARAEALASEEVQSLIWLDLNCLVVQPPELFDLGDEFDAALRPVHIRNVGLPPSEPPDPFWKGIYAVLGIEDLQGTVQSFIDQQCLRAYFNSHGIAIKPGKGLFQRWYQHFERLVCDRKFQRIACQDERHQIFLFQALFSALVASSVAPQRIRILPATYNYPYNLQGRVPKDRRAAALNELVCFTFEGRVIAPASVTDIEIREPLRTWLEAKVAVRPNGDAE